MFPHLETQHPDVLVPFIRAHLAREAGEPHVNLFEISQEKKGAKTFPKFHEGGGGFLPGQAT